MLVYTSDTSARPKGWDYFDTMVLWAVAQTPGPTLSTVMRCLPVGIAEHLVRKALDLAVAGGLLLRVADGVVTYHLTAAGRGQTGTLEQVAA